MDIRQYISNECIEKNGVWHLLGNSNFSYSDGKKTEAYIKSVIEKTKDVSSNSRELELYINNWATRYHLSRERSVAYWPMQIDPADRILEVGSGCGAITRYLGERAEHVLAIEGSPMRASITRARTADLKNVQVLCAPFQKINYVNQFDLIVCNGVLEYSSRFVADEDPYSKILDIFKSLLSDKGSLFLAIENQFGLRYFSSSREDHTNIMFDGIEGYGFYPDNVRTFGYFELKGLLQCRFEKVDTLFPLPDYKLPKAILHENLLDKVDASEVFASINSYDHITARRPLFSERLAWHEIGRNNMHKYFSNSLIFIAGGASQKVIPKNWLGSIYNINRKDSYNTITDINEDIDGQVVVRKKYFDGCFNDNAKEDFVKHSVGVESWKNGPSFHTFMASRMLLRNKPITVVFEPVKHWWDAVNASMSDNSIIPPDAIDKIWQNTTIRKNRITFIDHEWIGLKDATPEWLIARSVAIFIAGEIVNVHRWKNQIRFSTEWMLLKITCSTCGVHVSLLTYYMALKTERGLRKQVTGKNLCVWFVLLRSVFFPIQIRQYLYILTQMTTILIRRILAKIS